MHRSVIAQRVGIKVVFLTSVGVVAGLRFFKGALTINKEQNYSKRCLFDIKFISSQCLNSVFKN